MISKVQDPLKMYKSYLKISSQIARLRYHYYSFIRICFKYKESTVKSAFHIKFQISRYIISSLKETYLNQVQMQKIKKNSFTHENFQKLSYGDWFSNEHDEVENISAKHILCTLICRLFLMAEKKTRTASN